MKKTPSHFSHICLPMLVNGKRPHILLADDDEDDRDNFIEAFHDVVPEITITTETDGAKLMNRLNETETIPDILFLDLNMPRKNGFECLEEIRNLTKFNSTPIIIYSTSSNPELVNRSYDKGANLYLEKPQSFKEIKKLVERILLMNRDEFLPQPPKSKFVLK
jgi:CheY-like chemotaxis protein